MCICNSVCSCQTYCNCQVYCACNQVCSGQTDCTCAQHCTCEFNSPTDIPGFTRWNSTCSCVGFELTCGTNLP